MKPMMIKLSSIVVSIFLLSTSIILLSYAWFVQSRSIPQDIVGRTRTAYFAGGNGTSEEPFIIANANHFFNLSYLQNLGVFENVYPYFIVSDLSGNPITIDFAASNVNPIYRIIQPIGTDDYPFEGVFYGNNSVLESYVVDGYNKQDIGTFGFVGGSAVITDLFLRNPEILSNLPASTNPLVFHSHNDNHVNVATGYIVGHLSTGGVVERVYVMSPKISSLNNRFPNRTQYGLIGYNEADGGNIIGGPRDQSYNFDLDSQNAFTALNKASIDYGDYYVNGTSVQLKNVIVRNPQGVSDLDIAGEGNKGYPVTYSLSTLKISTTLNDPNPTTYLYDQMVADSNPIGNQAASYRRENVDVVGLVTFISSGGIYEMNLNATKTFITPTVGSTFNPSNYNQAIIMYVRPTNNLNNLGSVTGIYSGGGNLAYNSGYTTGGVYSPGVNTRRIAFSASGTTAVMKAVDALTAVTVDQDTGAMTVVNSATTTPDYYVFLLSLSNGQSRIRNIYFSYIPAALTIDAFESLSNVDFINDPSDVLGLANPNDYQYSLVNFGYELTGNQGIDITTIRLANQSFVLDIDYVVLEDFFFLDIINLNSIPIEVIANGIPIYSGTHQIIEIRFDTEGESVISRNLSP